MDAETRNLAYRLARLERCIGTASHGDVISTELDSQTTKGLNADKLDGQHALSFSGVNHTHHYGSLLEIPKVQSLSFASVNHSHHHDNLLDIPTDLDIVQIRVFT